jgi:hypothetical protein
MKQDALKFGERPPPVEKKHCQSCSHQQGAYRDLLREIDLGRWFGFPVVG